MAVRNRKVIPYRKPVRINVGIIIFLVMFLYLIFSAAAYLRREKVRYFEVQAGGMVNDKEYQGLILRTENVETAPAAGYINYYIREGKRAAVGTRIYSLDETGALKRFLDDNSSTRDTLSDQNVRDLKSRLTSFSSSYQPVSFSSVYDNRDYLRSSLSEFSSLNVMDALDQTLRDNGITFTRVTSPMTGVVSFNIDSYENRTPQSVTAEDFNASSYKASYINAGDRADTGDSIYKIIPSEDWQLVFPVTPEEEARYGDRKSLRVVFRGYDTRMLGDFEIVEGADGGHYGVVTFHQFMVRFVSDRYVNFHIIHTDEDGLKIPRTAITSKTFFKVPADLKTNGGNSVSVGFIKESYNNGEAAAEFVPAEIYYETEDFCYLDAGPGSAFSAGDYLLYPGSSDRYQIGETDELNGVYNINKGYAVFKQIDIIEENGEFVTVRRGTKYGLNVFDHIMLHGDEAEEGQPLYQ